MAWTTCITTLCFQNWLWRTWNLFAGSPQSHSSCSFQHFVLSNCLVNMGLGKDKLVCHYITSHVHSYSSHILTQESAARMNDCDNAVGLPATRRLFFWLDRSQGMKNILSKLIEKTPKKERIERYVAGPPVGRCIEKTRKRKTNFLSIMYQAIVPRTVSYITSETGDSLVRGISSKLDLFCYSADPLL